MSGHLGAVRAGLADHEAGDRLPARLGADLGGRGERDGRRAARARPRARARSPAACPRRACPTPCAASSSRRRRPPTTPSSRRHRRIAARATGDKHMSRLVYHSRGFAPGLGTLSGLAGMVGTRYRRPTEMPREMAERRCGRRPTAAGSRRAVVVIGAGPAGLTAAYELMKRRRRRRRSRSSRPTDVVGGISQTVAARRLALRHRRPPLLHEGRARSTSSGTRSSRPRR